MGKALLGKPEQKIRFGFMINNKYMVVPGFAIGNREMDDNGQMRLFIRL
ncbi:hypothetical protein [Niabella sp.]|nr:hypothetical protein [Niabella sp.]